MQRAHEAYLKDILEAIRKIEKYIEKMSYEDFLKDELRQDGVVKNLEIIGEAVNKISDEIKSRKPEVEWKKIAGLRDILTHEYNGGIDVSYTRRREALQWRTRPHTPESY